MPGSVVVTGGGTGVGAATAQSLIARGLEVTILVLEAPTWTHDRLTVITGDASDPADVERAAAAATANEKLVGWVNNAAVFEDAALHENPEAVLETVAANLVPAVVGTAEAVRRFLAAGTRGAIVNVSSHQAQRPVSGAMGYAVAKAAIEGLTRSTAVDYGPRGIRANAVALGSILTERFDGDAAVTGAAHPLGRMGEAREAAEAIAWLLSNPAGFVNGAILPVDGGRSVWGRDPEERVL